MKSIIEVECKCDAQDIVVNKRHQISTEKSLPVQKLLGELLVNLSCYGIKERCAVVEKFFEENPKLFPDDIKALVLTCYRKLRDERVEQTRKDANKRWHKDECAQTSVPSYQSNRS